MNTFFVDFEPASNNKEVYKIKGLQNKIIEIEPPRTTKKNYMIQCMRCQQYGHSKSYCNRPFAWVKCGGSHNTTECKKSSNTPAKCALCGGDHLANFKDCEHYQRLIADNNKPITQRTAATSTNTNIPHKNIQPIVHPQRPSYTEITKQSIIQGEDTHNIFSTFLDEFKNLFNQLMQQNSMILNMLTMLINKLN